MVDQTLPDTASYSAAECQTRKKKKNALMVIYLLTTFLPANLQIRYYTDSCLVRFLRFLQEPLGSPNMGIITPYRLQPKGKRD